MGGAKQTREIMSKRRQKLKPYRLDVSAQRMVRGTRRVIVYVHTYMQRQHVYMYTLYMYMYIVEYAFNTCFTMC